jgi:hypothetical protein
MVAGACLAIRQDGFAALDGQRKYSRDKDNKKQIFLYNTKLCNPKL